MGTTRTILFIAGAKSHGPEGNGVHDYAWEARVAAAMLLRSNIGGALRVRVVTDGWPRDARVLDDADALVLFCDGRDGDHFTEALHLAGPARINEVERLMARGCGLSVIHFGTFANQADAPRVLDWLGGYFQWQDDAGRRAWSSAITTMECPVEPCISAENPNVRHPALNGIAPFTLREEFYHDLTFPVADPAWTPLLSVPSLPAKRERGTIVAWARERADGGRAFGTTLGHFHANWRQSAYRTFLLNGIAWSAGIPIPKPGVVAEYLDREQAAIILGANSRLRVLLLAGNPAHAWHNWERSTPAIAAALHADPRIDVDIITDPNEFGRRELKDYAAIVLNYCNWQDPAPLNYPAKHAFSRFVRSGGGLVALHFSDGAFHPSLPGAAASDWPEYREMVPRQWDHRQADDGTTSAHDAYGTFIAKPHGDHVISANIAQFAVEDELYYRQRGDRPVNVVLSARSRDTGNDEPLAWTHRHGDGRVFQTLLGHSEKTYASFGAREMLRRAVAWAANREVKPIDPAAETASITIPATTETLIEVLS